MKKSNRFIFCAVLILINISFAAEPLFQSSLLFERQTKEDHYRGPRIIQLPSGRIVVGATLKLGHMRDTGGVDEGRFKYSDDDGQTWQTTEKYKIGDVVDSNTGKIWSISHDWPMNDAEGNPMTETWMINNTQKGIAIGSTMEISSSSDGVNWESKDITDKFFTYTNGGLAWFIGHGIQLEKGKYAGRLIIPGRYFGKEWDHCGPSMHNTLAYSDDDGKTWNWGGSAQGYTGEACIVELSDGSVYMSNRNHNPETAGYRSYCISKDGGKTFTEFGVEEELPEPRCHASMVRYSFPEEKTNTPGRVLFLNPSVRIPGTSIAPKNGRKNLTVKLSYDDCKTWPVSKTIDAGMGGYSDMIVTKDGTVICVFESGKEEIYAEDITLIRFNVEWLESGFEPKMK
ncbi:MAG: exo-alpha-sialidase [Sedimentisphaeraceae bacterium JB056]